MIVPDTSAWIEFLRATGSTVHLALRAAIREGMDVAVTEVVVMEVLAGARGPRHYSELRDGMLAFPVLTLEGIDDFEAAAELWRACRSGGETIRNMTDCLIAVPVIRAGAEVLHADGDFDVLARHTPLRVFAAGT